MAPKPFWSDERIAIIREHASTMSAGQIATAFFPGMTRSAIMGIAHRNGIVMRKASTPPRPLQPLHQKRATIANPSPAKKLTHMRGSSAPQLVRPRMQRSLPPPPKDPEPGSHGRMSFEITPHGSWTLWNIGADQCRFPTGHNGTLTLFCGEITSQKMPPYCRYHTWRTNPGAFDGVEPQGVPA